MKKIILLFISFLTVGCGNIKDTIKHAVLLDLDTDYDFREKESAEKEPPKTETPKVENKPQPGKEDNTISPKPDVEKTPTTKPTVPIKETKPTESKENNPIMTLEQIATYNKEIAKKTDALYDIENIKALSKDEILKLIEDYKMPNLPKYDNGKNVTAEQIDEILANRDIENVVSQTSLKRGLVTSRTNLRAFPTDVHFYRKQTVQNFDDLQETELSINTPVLLLHTSKDDEWQFVISPIYSGWIKKSDYAEISPKDFTYFTNPKDFAVITAPSLKIDGSLFDMGVKLPLIREDTTNLYVAIPKNESSNFSTKTIAISKTAGQKGYLPYTKENVLYLATRYLNAPYSWGGLDNGVDCSSFIMNIYRTFGFVFPRNTSDQKTSIGKVITLNGQTAEQKLAVIGKSTVPPVLYQPGHAMLYIGLENGKPIVIHASGDALKVTKTELSKNSNYLTKIDRAIEIK